MITSNSCADGTIYHHEDDEMFDPDAREIYHQAYTKEKYYMAKLDLIEAVIRLHEKLTDRLK